MNVNKNNSKGPRLTACITGPQGSGKTSTLLRLLKHPQLFTLNPQAILSPGSWLNNKRNEIFLLNFSSNQKLKLAERNADADFRFGHFGFFNDAFRSSQKWTRLALQLNPPIFALDEIGPVELMGKGFADSLTLIAHANLPLFIFTCRTGLHEPIIRLFQLPAPYIFTPKKNVQPIISWILSRIPSRHD